MNTENILKVADAIERCTIPGLKFDMGDFCFTDDCGTVACIAGWAWHVRNQMDHPMSEAQADNYDSGYAAEFFDIDEDAANALFMGGPYLLADITQEMAVVCLRNLAATGKVDWFAADESVS